MKKTGKEPRLLQSVMEAIAMLKEKQGSSQKQIIEHVTNLLKKNKDGARNVTMQVRRALDHGLHTGLIRHRSGKYVLGLDKRDYAIFRRFRQIAPSPTACRRRRRGKRGRRRRRRRRGGRRRNYSNDDHEGSEESESGRSTAGGTPEPQDRSRRRRRRGGRRRRKSRRRRGRRHSSQDNKSESESEAKSSKSDLPAEKRRSESEKVDYQQKNSHHPERESPRNQEDDCMVDCGNPECLCNIKQEEDSPRSMSRENYYNDSYLN
ncbi:serine/arginine-rich splicing factor 11-like [Anthonomus grandis grandis]|uniref:serine/arginine-rich splicing factor 11-like n=1 Tax=Anthonomus grandis grandis TaxID=2921223 RepID=UPI002166AFFC|nr:serine/arginine-rich splicing factor 11-like [Anthonomus grandis grandis]